MTQSSLALTGQAKRFAWRRRRCVRVNLSWGRSLCLRINRAKAVTAAHKLARPIYAMLSKGEDFTDWGQGQFSEGCCQRVFHKLSHPIKTMVMQLMPSETSV